MSLLLECLLWDTPIPPSLKFQTYLPIYSQHEWLFKMWYNFLFKPQTFPLGCAYFAHHCMFVVHSIYTQYNLLNEYEINMNMLVIERILYILTYITIQHSMQRSKKLVHTWREIWGEPCGVDEFYLKLIMCAPCPLPSPPPCYWHYSSLDHLLIFLRCIILKMLVYIKQINEI